jgi:hypothetical protein
MHTKTAEKAPRRLSKLAASKKKHFTPEGKAERVAKALAALHQDQPIRLSAEEWKRAVEEGDVSFWEEKPLDQLAAEQAVRPIQRLDDILGAGAELWENDRDLEDFLQSIYQRRREEKDNGRSKR